MATLHHATPETPLSMHYKGRSFHPRKALLDVCTDIGFISTAAACHGLEYHATKTAFNSSGGIPRMSQIPKGQVDIPIHTTIQASPETAATTHSYPATTFALVDKISTNVHVLLPSVVLADWGAMVDPSCNVLR